MPPKSSQKASHLTMFKGSQNINDLFVQFNDQKENIFTDRARNDIWTVGSSQVRSAASAFSKTLEITQSEQQDQKSTLQNLDEQIKRILDNQDEFLDPDQIEGLPMTQINQTLPDADQLFKNNENLDDLEIFSTAFDTVNQFVTNSQVQQMLLQIKNILLQKAVRKTSIQNAQQFANKILDEKLQLELKNNVNLNLEIDKLQDSYNKLQRNYNESNDRNKQLQLAFINLQNENSYFQQEKKVLTDQNLASTKEIRARADEKIEFQERFKRQQLVLQKMRTQLNEQQHLLQQQNSVIKQLRDDKDDLNSNLSREQNTVEKQQMQIDRLTKQLSEAISSHQIEIEALNNRILSGTANTEGIAMDFIDNDNQYSQCIQNSVAALVAISDPQNEEKLLSEFGLSRENLFNLKFVLTNLKDADLSSQLVSYFHNDFIQLYIDKFSIALQTVPMLNISEKQKPIVLTKFVNNNKTPRLPKLKKTDTKDRLIAEMKKAQIKESMKIQKNEQKITQNESDLSPTKLESCDAFDGINKFSQDNLAQKSSSRSDKKTPRVNKKAKIEQMNSLNNIMKKTAEKTAHKKVKNVIQTLGLQFSKVVKTFNLELNPQPLDQMQQLGDNMTVELPQGDYDELTINENFVKLLNKIIKKLPNSDQASLRQQVIDVMFKHKEHLKNKQEFKHFYNTFKYETDNLLDSDEDTDEQIVYEEQREGVKKKLQLFLDQVENLNYEYDTPVLSVIVTPIAINGAESKVYFDKKKEISTDEDDDIILESLPLIINSNLNLINDEYNFKTVHSDNVDNQNNEQNKIKVEQEEKEESRGIVRNNTSEFRQSKVYLNQRISIEHVVENLPMKKIIRTSSRAASRASARASNNVDNSETDQNLQSASRKYLFPQHIKKNSKLNIIQNQDIAVKNYLDNYDQYVKNQKQQQILTKQDIDKEIVKQVDLLKGLNLDDLEQVFKYLIKNNVILNNAGEQFTPQEFLIIQKEIEIAAKEKQNQLRLQSNTSNNSLNVQLEQKPSDGSIISQPKLSEIKNDNLNGTDGNSSTNQCSSCKKAMIETNDSETQTMVNVTDTVADLIIFKDMKQLLQESMNQKVDISEQALDNQTLYINNQLSNVNLRQEIVKQCVPQDLNLNTESENLASALEMVQDKLQQNINQSISNKVAQVSTKSKKAIKEPNQNQQVISQNKPQRQQQNDDQLQNEMKIREIKEKQITEAQLKLHPYYGQFEAPSFESMVDQPFIEQFILQHPIDRIYYQYLPLQKDIQSTMFAPCIVSTITQQQLFDKQLQNNTRRYFINQINLKNSKSQIFIDEQEKLKTIQTLIPKIGQSVGFIRLSSCSVLSSIPKIFTDLQAYQTINFINFDDQQYITVPMQQVQLKTPLWITKLTDQILKDRNQITISQISQVVQSDLIKINEGNFEVISGQIQSKQAMSLGAFTIYWALQKYGVKSLALSLIWNLIANLAFHQYQDPQIYIFARLFFNDLDLDYLEIYLDLVQNLSTEPIQIDQVPTLVKLLVPSFSHQRVQSFHSSLLAISYQLNNCKYLDFSLFSSLLLFAYGSYRKSNFQAMIQIFRNFGISLGEAQYREFLSLLNLKMKNFTISESFYAFQTNNKFDVQSIIRFFTCFQIPRFTEISSKTLNEIVSNDIQRMNKSCAIVFQQIQASLFKIQRFMNKFQLQKLKSAVEIVKADIIVFDVQSAIDGFQNIVQLAIHGLGQKAPDACLAVMSGTVSALNQVIGDI